jgi:hypothetical protein
LGRNISTNSGEPSTLARAFCRIARVVRLEIGVGGRLGVDHDGAPARQAHHRVRARRNGFVGHAELLVEIDVAVEAREFEGTAQRVYAPLAAHGRVLERCGKVGRGHRQAVAALAQALDLLGQSAVALGARLFDFGKPHAHFFERLAHGRYHLAHRLLAFFEIAFGDFLFAREARFGKFEELRGRGLQRFGRQRVERVDEALFGRQQQPLLLGPLRAFGREFGFEARRLGANFGKAALRAREIVLEARNAPDLRLGRTLSAGRGIQAFAQLAFEIGRLDQLFLVDRFAPAAAHREVGADGADQRTDEEEADDLHAG